MNRLATVLALVAALALSTAVGASAAPGADGLPTAGAAAAKAKKKAAKRKAGNCNGQAKKRAKARKRGNRKATGRARRAAADSAQAKRRGARRKAGRKKAGRCKTGKRGKGKRAPRTKRREASEGFAVGHYEDEAKGVVAVNEGGGSGKMAFVIPQQPVCPAPGALIGLEGTLTETGKGARIVGEGGSFLAVKAVMTIEPNLSYRLEITYTLRFGDAEPCQNGATITGKLARSTPSASTAAKGGAGPALGKCGKAKRRAASLTGARKRRALRAAAACRRQNSANRKAFKQIRDRRFTGTRGDGAGVDHLFCASGRYETATSSGGSRGLSEGRTWRVTDASVKRGGRWLTAIVRDPGKGFAVGIARRGAQWQVGIVSFDTDVGQLGDVDRFGARGECERE